MITAFTSNPQTKSLDQMHGQLRWLVMRARTSPGSSEYGRNLLRRLGFWLNFRYLVWRRCKKVSETIIYLSLASADWHLSLPYIWFKYLVWRLVNALRCSYNHPPKVCMWTMSCLQAKALNSMWNATQHLYAVDSCILFGQCFARRVEHNIVVKQTT